MITFESPRKRANRFLFMLGLLGILTIASTILTVSEISLLEQNQAGEEVTYSDIVAPLDNDWIISSVRSLFWTSVFCAILFLMWKHRASKNLAPLGVSNQRFSPRWAVAYYFIPILNLFRPYQLMKEIYLHSGGGGASTPSESILAAWWGMFLISGYFNKGIARQIFKENDIDALIELSYANIVGDFLIIVEGILVFVVVRRITENQETKWIKIAETKEIRIPSIPPKSFPAESN